MTSSIPPNSESDEDLVPGLMGFNSEDPEERQAALVLFERVMNSLNMSEPSKEWTRKHPQFLLNKTTHHRVLSSHHLAIAKKIPTDTPEYFAFIEQNSGFVPFTPTHTIQ